MLFFIPITILIANVFDILRKKSLYLIILGLIEYLWQVPLPMLGFTFDPCQGNTAELHREVMKIIGKQLCIE